MLSGDRVTEVSDQELVSRCLEAGQSYDAAFQALYERHSPRVFGFLLKLTHSRGAAEDALQETFLRVYKSLERFDSGRDLGAWLLQIAKVQRIADVQAGNGARRPLEFPVTGVGKGDHRAVQALAHPAGDQPDNPLVPIRIIETQPPGRILGEGRIGQLRFGFAPHPALQGTAVPIQFIELGGKAVGFRRRLGQ